MKFNISFGNLYSPSQAYNDHVVQIAVGSDITTFTRKALELGGHEVNINLGYVDRDAINIFFERFMIPQQAAELRKAGYRFGIVCTEMLEVEGQYNPFEFGAE